MSSRFTDPSQLPELIIPFFITFDEARERMLDWGKNHKSTPEGKGIVSSMGNFCGCYLPYRIVYGPVEASVSRDGNKRDYECSGYLEGTAVNTSKQLDNMVLNGMEPFDWSEAKPFDYGFIAGQRVKLNDSSEKDIEVRIRTEAEEDFLPEVQRVLQTDGVNVNVRTGKLNKVPALLPAYFIKSGKLTAVMNGQTGRIAVTRERHKKTSHWVIEPLIYTVLLTVLMGFLFNWNPEMLFYSAAVFGCIIFGLMSAGRESIYKRIIRKSRNSKARRQDGELVIDEGKNILKNPYDNTPVFMEPDDTGEPVPVKIRFYSVGRWLSIVLRSLITVFLPAILAAVIRWITMGSDEKFMDKFVPLNGAAWYVLALFIVLIYFVKGVRKDVYDHPIIRRILPNGKTRLMGSRRDRKLSILSIFDLDTVDENGKRESVIKLLIYMGKAGIGILLVFVLILAGSTAAIIS
ncbi:MAG: hypothetical protein IJM62_01415 [Lachnospiraceae bacterium]|nr:hypothetical protein [Lachnospiraceae bacterium]